MGKISKIKVYRYLITKRKELRDTRDLHFTNMYDKNYWNREDSKSSYNDACVKLNLIEEMIIDLQSENQ